MFDPQMSIDIPTVFKTQKNIPALDYGLTPKKLQKSLSTKEPSASLPKSCTEQNCDLKLQGVRASLNPPLDINSYFITEIHTTFDNHQVQSPFTIERQTPNETPPLKPT
jgi:hypothetical protein